MKKKLAMQSRLHPARSHSSDEEEDRIGEEWIARRREPHHNSHMKAKRKAANKACWEQFEERARDGKQRFVVDLDDNGIEFCFISLYAMQTYRINTFDPIIFK